MLYGYDDLIADFKRLIEKQDLSHAYLLYGEPQIGKFLFAQSLANYLENGIFDESAKPLQECMAIDFSASSGEEGEEGNKESIGIDQVRRIEHFLYQTPLGSSRRIVIIRDAHWLTDQAQNALLKILEEPPAHGLIIATAQSDEVFLPALRSRFQKIYMRTLPEKDILDFLDKYGKISPSRSVFVKESFGRIGRLKTLLSEQPPERIEAEALAKRIASAPARIDPKKMADEAMEFLEKDPSHEDMFFGALISLLRADPVRNARALGEISSFLMRSNTMTLNRRLHLKQLLWMIRSYSP